MSRGGFVNKGRCQFVWDPDYQSPEDITDELWDENIDYILALRAIVADTNNSQARIAQAVLAKYGKEEEPTE